MKRNRVLIIILLLLTSILLPWMWFSIWDSLPYDLKGSSSYIRTPINIFFGVLSGFLMWRFNLKLRILIIYSGLFLISNIQWNIHHFEINKLDYKNGLYDLPASIPECTKEINYSDFWDYVSNGCHYTTEELGWAYFDRLLIVIIVILTTRILLIGFTSRSKRKNRNRNLLDQE